MIDSCNVDDQGRTNDGMYIGSSCDIYTEMRPRVGWGSPWIIDDLKDVLAWRTTPVRCAQMLAGSGSHTCKSTRFAAVSGKGTKDFGGRRLGRETGGVRS